MFKNSYSKPSVVAHVFSPSTGELKTGYLGEFEASLIYLVSFRPARATETVPPKK